MNGIVLSRLNDQQRTLFRRQHIGFIYQSFNLIETLSAAENIEIPLQLNNVSRRDRLQRTQAMLEIVGLGDRADAFPEQLSGGEQQRVAIARAMVHRPALVLADEHTGNLDNTSSDAVMRLFDDLARETGQAVLMVTHSRRIAATADRVMAISNGLIETVDDGVPDDGRAGQSQR